MITMSSKISLWNVCHLHARSTVFKPYSLEYQELRWGIRIHEVLYIPFLQKYSNIIFLDIELLDKIQFESVGSTIEKTWKNIGV